MWKKALWIYVGLYVLGMLAGTVYSIVVEANAGNFQLAALIMPLVMLAPALVVALELRGKKSPRYPDAALSADCGRPAGGYLQV